MTHTFWNLMEPNRSPEMIQGNSVGLDQGKLSTSHVTIKSTMTIEEKNETDLERK
jgi:hypothetical protein